MKTRHVIKILTLILILAFYYFNSDIFIPSQAVENEPVSGIEYNLEEEIFEDIEVVFCPSEECYDLFENSFRGAKEEIKCAFYEFCYI